MVLCIPMYPPVCLSIFLIISVTLLFLLYLLSMILLSDEVIFAGMFCLVFTKFCTSGYLCDSDIKNVLKTP